MNYESLYQFFKSWGLYSTKRLEILNALTVIGSNKATRFDNKIKEYMDISEDGKKYRTMIKNANVQRTDVQLNGARAKDILTRCDRVVEITKRILADLESAKIVIDRSMKEINMIIANNRLQNVLSVDLENIDILIRELSVITKDYSDKRAFLKTKINKK